MKNKKEERLKAIAHLIESHAIEDQEHLADLLARNYGIVANQSIISRDLRILGIAKRIRQGKSVYELQKIDVNKEILYYAVIDLVYNETTIIIHTLAGLASFVGDYIDNQDIESIVATVAGENVVLVIPKTIKNIKTTYNTVCSLLSFKSKE